MVKQTKKKKLLILLMQSSPQSIQSVTTMIKIHTQMKSICSSKSIFRNVCLLIQIHGTDTWSKVTVREQGGYRSQIYFIFHWWFSGLQHYLTGIAQTLMWTSGWWYNVNASDTVITQKQQPHQLRTPVKMWLDLFVLHEVHPWRSHARLRLCGTNLNYILKFNALGDPRYERSTRKQSSMDMVLNIKIQSNLNLKSWQVMLRTIHE
jgi:hypothetical protein